MDNLYDTLIADYASKGVRKEVQRIDKEADVHNRLCGDHAHIKLMIKDNKIDDAGYEMDACILCRASAAMLIEAIDGLECAQALTVSHAFQNWLKSHDDDVPNIVKDRPYLKAFDALRDYPARLRCGTLPWEAFERALKEES